MIAVQSQAPRRGARRHSSARVVIVAAVLLMLYIGFSRIFVGDNYPMDVLAGYGLGLAWAGLVYTTMELIFKRNKAPKEI